MNPYQSPDEIVRAEVIEETYPDARWYHIAFGPFVVGCSMLGFWLFGLDGWSTVFRFLGL